MRQTVWRGSNPSGNRGRPATGSDKVLTVRLSAEQFKALARFRSRYAPEMTTSEALRCALAIGMETHCNGFCDSKSDREFRRKRREPVSTSKP